MLRWVINQLITTWGASPSDVINLGWNQQTLVGGLEHFFIFPYIGPNWRTQIFQRGRSTTNQFGNAGNLCQKMDDLARHVSFSTGSFKEDEGKNRRFNGGIWRSLSHWITDVWNDTVRIWDVPQFMNCCSNWGIFHTFLIYPLVN